MSVGSAVQTDVLGLVQSVYCGSVVTSAVWSNLFVFNSVKSEGSKISALLCKKFAAAGCWTVRVYCGQKLKLCWGGECFGWAE